MKCFQSIRWRLQTWHALLLVLVLAGFGFTAWRLQRATLLQRVDEELEQRISVLAGAMRRGSPAPGAHPQPDRPPPQERPAFEDLPPRPLETRLGERDLMLFEALPGRPAFYYVLWQRDNREAARSATAPPDVPRPERGALPRDSRLRGVLRERVHFLPPGDCILVGRDATEELAGVRRFAWLLAGAGGLVLLLGLAGGAWVVARALRPIQEISAAADKIATGDLSQRIATADSESELGQLAGVLNSTFARLDAAFAQQARFTADAAHELRTPVTVMLTHTQNGLASDCPNDEHREAFAACQRAAQRMRRLIESLLELARLDAGQETLRRDDCDLCAIAAAGIELVRPLAAARGIQIHARLLAAPCQGDSDRLLQVATNLLSNAIEYNRTENGEIRISTSKDARSVSLLVCNAGPGISPEDLPHIFERFYRADKARSGTAGHSGLGLAIAKATVQAHGGALSVQSEPGKETVFTVTLPL